MESIISSSIAGILALIGVIVTNLRSESRITTKVENQLITAQEVTNTKIEYLANEVNKHNNFASRMPAVEEKVNGLTQRVEALEHRK